MVCGLVAVVLSYPGMFLNRASCCPVLLLCIVLASCIRNAKQLFFYGDRNLLGILLFASGFLC